MKAIDIAHAAADQFLSEAVGRLMESARVNLSSGEKGAAAIQQFEEGLREAMMVREAAGAIINRVIGEQP